MDTHKALEILGRVDYSRVTQEVREAACEVAYRIHRAMREHDITLIQVPVYGRLEVSTRSNGYVDHWEVIERMEWVDVLGMWAEPTGNLMIPRSRWHPAGFDRAAPRLEVLRFVTHLECILHALDEAIQKRESQAPTAEQAVKSALESGRV